jgi:mediator of RNA polymerase II transcription subunit 10
VELARRSNQLMKGKEHAFRSFRDVLAGEMGRAMPELEEDIVRVIRATDEDGEAVVKKEES